MAIFIKKKVVPVVEVPVVEEQQELSQRQLDALEAVGLAPEKPQEKQKKVLVLNKRAFKSVGVGDVVRLLNPVPWNKKYEEGESAEVVKCWGIKQCDATAVDIDPVAWALFEVRTKSTPSLLVRRFNMDVVNNVPKVSQSVEEAASC